jgi:uncharacterized protein (UPF0333 family)
MDKEWTMMEQFDVIKLTFLFLTAIIVLVFTVGVAYMFGFEQGAKAVIDTYNLNFVVGG